MSSIIPLVCRICQRDCAPGDFYLRGDGKRRAECKACTLARQKATRDTNIDAARAKQNERYHARKNDPAYIQGRRDERARNRDKILAKKAEYRAARREELNAKEHERYHQKRDEINEKTREKRATNPEHFRQITKRKYWKHREQDLQKSREWRIANPERRRANNRRWFENNRQRVYQLSRINKAKRRDWAAGARYSLAHWNAMCEWFGSVCLCCGSNAPLTVDHVIPLSRGGTNTIENLQPLCKPCNMSKNNRHSTDYRAPDRLAEFLASISH